MNFVKFFDIICLCVHHTEFAYSKICGRTIDTYNNMKVDSSMYIEFRLILPSHVISKC